MRSASEYNPISKVHYRPLEAAIRWSGLTKHERQILGALKEKTIPDPDDFPKWPALRLNTERIYDAIANRELPCAIDGVGVQDESAVDNPDLTVRHVDLKSWMARYYPADRPDFLFSPLERSLHPAITIESVQALMLEQDAMKLRLHQRDREIQCLRHRQSALKKVLSRTRSKIPDSDLGARSETTYLHIVGGLMDLILGHSPSGQPQSSFRTQDAVISSMVAHHGERLGISKSTLEAKFAAAKRLLAQR